MLLGGLMSQPLRTTIYSLAHQVALMAHRQSNIVVYSSTTNSPLCRIGLWRSSPTVREQLWRDLRSTTYSTPNCTFCKLLLWFLFLWCWPCDKGSNCSCASRRISSGLVRFFIWIVYLAQIPAWSLIAQWSRYLFPLCSCSNKTNQTMLVLLRSMTSSIRCLPTIMASRWVLGVFQSAAIHKFSYIHRNYQSRRTNDTINPCRMGSLRRWSLGLLREQSKHLSFLGKWDGTSEAVWLDIYCGHAWWWWWSVFVHVQQQCDLLWMLIIWQWFCRTIVSRNQYPTPRTSYLRSAYHPQRRIQYKRRHDNSTSMVSLWVVMPWSSPLIHAILM